MEIQQLNVKTRSTSGKGHAGKARAEGKVPCILYGGGKDPLSLELDRRQFEAMLQTGRGGQHAVIQLQVTDKPEANTPALIKAVQHHPVRGLVMHADFMRIRLDEHIQTLVPIRLEGQAPGVVEGGIIDHQMRELEVECLAREVPAEIVVDISGLNLGDAIHVSGLAVPANVTVLTDPERPVVTIHVPRAAKEAEAVEGAAEGEAEAEPEVIGEQKEKE